MSDNEDQPELNEPEQQEVQENGGDDNIEPKNEDEPPKDEEKLNEDKPEDGEPKPDEENPDGEKKEGEEGEEGEKKIVEPPEPDVELPTLNLKEDEARTLRIIKKGLTKIQKVSDNSGYAFTDLNIENKEILKLYECFKNYQHVRYCNVSNNKIEDISSVDLMPYLLQLNASKNNIENMRVFTFQKLYYLTELNLSNNKIVKLPGIFIPCLKKLNLSENAIESCHEFRGHQNLESLLLRKNKIKDCRGLKNLPALQELDLSENEIVHFYDLSNLPNLKTLNLKKNKIAGFEKNLPALPTIETLNLEENLMTEVSHFKRLQEIPSLKTLLFVSNPMSEEIGDGLKKILIKMFLPKVKPSDVAENAKKEVPPIVPDIKLVNEDPVEPADIEGFWDEALEEEKKRLEEEEARRLEEEEKKRLEEEERKKKEEEEAAAAEAEAEAQRERERENALKEVDAKAVEENEES